MSHVHTTLNIIITSIRKCHEYANYVKLSIRIRLKIINVIFKYFEELGKTKRKRNKLSLSIYLSRSGLFGDKTGAAVGGQAQFRKLLQ